LELGTNAFSVFGGLYQTEIKAKTTFSWGYTSIMSIEDTDIHIIFYLSELIMNLSFIWGLYI